MDISEDLELKLKNLPVSSGVYIFKDAAGKIIYIGKAKVLRSRVRSYFRSAKGLDPKTLRMRAKVVDLELMVTDSEVEALILEANLIREHKPLYNVDLKDDKHFPYVKVTTDEQFPRVLVVRRLEKDGATYFGPYTSSRTMRKTVNFLTQLFRIRSCSLVIPHPSGRKQEVCLDYQIDRCGGPCEMHQSREDYQELVDGVIMALSGKTKRLIEQLTRKMLKASRETEYEAAGRYRDQIEGLKSLAVKQNVDVGVLVDRDIVSIARERRDAVAIVMQVRDGVLIGRQDFRLTSDVDESDLVVLETFLAQYYNYQPNLPEEVFLPMEVANRLVFQRWLTRLKGRQVKLVTPKAGRKVKLVGLAAQNARLLLDELLIQKKSQSERTSKLVTCLKDDLHLSASPRSIVCFDISNTGETDAVGSCVYFVNAKPKKSQYRHFKIKGVSGQDDFKMMREVIGRYFHRIKEENLSPPDLIVVDGGKGQLSAARAELKFLGFDDQPIVGLAKRLEEVFLPEMKAPLTISRSSPSLLLLRRVRDEAHRFAITFNRKVRSKRTIHSALDDIPGIGPARRQMLLKKFGSVKRIRAASVEQIAEVQGVSRKLAEQILESLSAGN